MRESIGSTWILQLVIVFILLFVGFLTLSLGYSKSFKVRNEILSILEKSEGITDDAVRVINNYLEYNSYNVKGRCENNEWYGLDNFGLTKLEQAQNNKKYYYCIKKMTARNERVYYIVNTFYNFNLPVVGDFVTFTLDGTTMDIVSSDGYNAYNAYN